MTLRGNIDIRAWDLLEGSVDELVIRCTSVQEASYKNMRAPQSIALSLI